MEMHRILCEALMKHSLPFVIDTFCSVKDWPPMFRAVPVQTAILDEPNSNILYVLGVEYNTVCTRMQICERTSLATLFASLQRRPTRTQ